MLHTAIGEDRFRSCLGGFLKLNRFKTAEPLDLWNICTKKANSAKNIKVGQKLSLMAIFSTFA